MKKLILIVFVFFHFGINFTMANELLDISVEYDSCDRSFTMVVANRSSLEVEIEDFFRDEELYASSPGNVFFIITDGDTNVNESLGISGDRYSPLMRGSLSFGKGSLRLSPDEVITRKWGLETVLRYPISVRERELLGLEEKVLSEESELKMFLNALSRYQVQILVCDPSDSELHAIETLGPIVFHADEES